MDRRAVKPGTEAPIKITLCLKGKTTTIPTGIKLMPEQWDPETRQVVRHPQKLMLNTALAGRKNDIDMALLRLI